MSLSLERIKSHLRVPHDLEDGDIQDYIDFAKSDVIEAVYDGRDPSLDESSLEEDPSFRKAVIMLTNYYYENRLTLSEMNIKEAPFSVTHAIQNLRANKDRHLKDVAHE